MLPIFYSFRRCPYAIRARLAIKYSKTNVELREVILADKPEGMLTHSAKGTVPVLILPNGTVIDESLDIMHWALSINDPENWLDGNADLLQKTRDLIKINDGSFKEHLDHYKYSARFPEYSAEHYRNQANEFLQTLENLLGKYRFLFSNHITMADTAIFPFVRQFAFVDKAWFDQSEHINLKAWLKNMLEMGLFLEVMEKYPQWKPENSVSEF